MVRFAALGLVLALACGVQSQSDGIDELRVPGNAIASVIERGLSNAKLHLGGGPAGCSVNFGRPGESYTFTLPDRVVSLGYLGDVRYRVTSIDLKDVKVACLDGRYAFQFGFRSHGAALKGSHSLLGDAAVPDVELRNMRLALTLKPVLDDGGGITYAEPQVRFSADVDNTFIPRFSIAGYTFDVVDALTDYRRELCKTIGIQLQRALDDPTRKAALSARLHDAVFASAADSPLAGISLDRGDVILRFRQR